MLAGGAQAPVHNLGFVYCIAVVLGGFQAWRSADGTINIHRGLASPADQVMVIVADAGFVQCRTSSGLDSPDDSSGDESIQVVVHGLSGQGAQPPPRRRSDKLSVFVFAVKLNRLKNRQALRSHSQLCGPEELLDFVPHRRLLYLYLDSVQISA